MIQMSDFLARIAAPTSRRAVRWQRVLHGLAPLTVAGGAAGCANDVVMRDPRTGMTETCQESVRGLNPWSQTVGCVADHVAQGWTRTSQE